MHIPKVTNRQWKSECNVPCNNKCTNMTIPKSNCDVKFESFPRIGSFEQFVLTG